MCVFGTCEPLPSSGWLAHKTAADMESNEVVKCTIRRVNVFFFPFCVGKILI